MLGITGKNINKITMFIILYLINSELMIIDD